MAGLPGRLGGLGWVSSGDGCQLGGDISWLGANLQLRGAWSTADSERNLGGGYFKSPFECQR